MVRGIVVKLGFLLIVVLLVSYKVKLLRLMHNIKPSSSHAVSAFDLVVTDKLKLVLMFLIHFTINQLS